MEFTAARRASFRPPSCPECGGRVTFAWVESTSAADSVRTWAPSAPRCTRRDCALSESSVADFGGYFD